MYFKKAPLLYYTFDVGNKVETKIVRDITHNVRFRKAILENITLFDEYDMQEGDTPEIVAYKVYGSAEYHWVVMLCNQRYDYLNDFPKSQRDLEAYIFDKYDEPYGVHHYVNEQGFIVSADDVNALPVSNYQYEQDVNESKRRIKLISPQLLSTILTEYRVI